MFNRVQTDEEFFALSCCQSESADNNINLVLHRGSRLHKADDVISSDSDVYEFVLKNIEHEKVDVNDLYAVERNAFKIGKLTYRGVGNYILCHPSVFAKYVSRIKVIDYKINIDESIPDNVLILTYRNDNIKYDYPLFLRGTELFLNENWQNYFAVLEVS